MLKVKYPIIVEGKYDKSRLASIVDAEIIVTNGFGIFKNKDKVKYLQNIAKSSKLILLTDSDVAGFKIRGYLNGCLPKGSVVHIYIPQVLGKEPRKQKASAEGTLGVEGIPVNLLRTALANADVLEKEVTERREQITRQMLYQLGLSGGNDSSLLREKVKLYYQIPAGINSNGLATALSRITDITELTERVQNIKNELAKE